jgi:hypothetical protein
MILGLNSDIRTQCLGGSFICIFQEKVNINKSRGKEGEKEKEIHNIFVVYLFYDDDLQS